MTPIWAIIVKETKLLVRDPGSLFLLFMLPAVFIFILSVTLQGVFSEESTQRIQILMVNDDPGEIGADIIREIEETGHFKVVTERWGRPITLDDAKAALDDGNYKMAVHIPAKSTEAARFKADATIEVFFDPILSKDFTARMTSELTVYAYALSLEQTGKRVDRIKENIDKLRSVNDELRDAVEELLDVNEELEEGIEELAEANGQLIKANEKLIKSMGRMKAKMETEVAEMLEKAKKAGMPDSMMPETGQGDILVPKKTSRPDMVDLEEKKKKKAEKISLETLPDKVEAIDHEFQTGFAGLTVERKWYASGDIKALPSAIQQTVPGWTLFALFWICQTLALNLLIERQSGAYRRLLVSPIAAVKFYIGKIIPFFVLNMLQALFTFSLGVYILPMLGIGALEIKQAGGLALLTAVFSIVSIGFGFFIAAISKTLSFSAIISATLSIVMAAVSGIMVPKFVMPRFMQTVGRFTPHGWALDGYLDLLVRDRGMVHILPYVGILCLFAIVIYALAIARMRKLNRNA
ncbi:MAG: ABC transporter permease [Pseudomonadota bacterium]